MSDNLNKASVQLMVDWGKALKRMAFTTDARAVAHLSKIYGDSPEGLIAAADQAGVPVALIARHAVPRTQIWAVWVEARKHGLQLALLEVVAVTYPAWKPALESLISEIGAKSP